ncbi:MAG: rhodanese-like domain-containing protein [Burkholderiaceae bacterium]
MAQLGLAITMALLTQAVQAAGHEAVSADAAAQAMAHGASVVDVRSPSAYAAGHLPGAARLPQEAAILPLEQLERLVSAAGLDLSRTVLVVGEPGDANAQALWHALGAYASGRVLWLVGGALEWHLRGYQLSTQATVLPAVPQYLVAHQTHNTQYRMAGEALRLGSMPATQVQLSFSVK